MNTLEKTENRGNRRNRPPKLNFSPVPPPQPQQDSPSYNTVPEHYESYNTVPEHYEFYVHVSSGKMVVIAIPEDKQTDEVMKTLQQQFSYPVERHPAFIIRNLNSPNPLDQPEVMIYGHKQNQRTSLGVMLGKLLETTVEIFLVSIRRVDIFDSGSPFPSVVDTPTFEQEFEIFGYNRPISLDQI